MRLLEADGVKFVRFEALAGVGHCFSTRVGGVSEGCFASLNLGAGRGDGAVAENFARLGRAAGFKPETVVRARQAHGAAVALARPGVVEEADGLLTDQPGLTLATFHADCVPLFFYDPVRKAAAVAHAGWRGTLAGIGKAVVAEMRRRFGSRPGDLAAAIGPAIGPCCFEVDPPLAETFLRDLPEAAGLVWPGRPGRPGHPAKFFLDLWEINRAALGRAGVGQVEVARLCTHCREDLFFSHRRTGERRGSMAALIWLL
jgi:YfiH family protein